MPIIENIKYYLLTSYRRKMLDKALAKNRHLFNGDVLDIGGGKKDGRFIPPKTNKWVIADMRHELNPDVIASVEKLPFKTGSFDTIKATELFEHVEDFEKGFRECYRVLKKGGNMIISVPFMYPFHPDPGDYQRITVQKWQNLARQYNMKITVEEQGHFLTVLAESWRCFVVNLQNPIRYFLYFTFPLADLLTILEKNSNGKNFYFKGFIEGYFMVFKK